MGYGAPREGNAHRGSPMKGHQRSLGAGARFHRQHLRVHSSGARRLAAYHDDRRRLTVTEAVLTVNARYRGPKEKTAGRVANVFDGATTTDRIVVAFGGRRQGGLLRGRKRERERKRRRITERKRIRKRGKERKREGGREKRERERMREKEQKGMRVCQIDELRPITGYYEEVKGEYPIVGID